MLQVKVKRKKRIPQWLLPIVIIFFIVALLTTGAYFAFTRYYQNKFYPNIILGNTNIGGLTLDQANDLLNKQIDRFNQNGIIFSYQGQEAVLTPLVASVETDLAYSVFNFNVENSAKLAFAYGRNPSFLIALNQKINSILYKKHFDLLYDINNDEVKKTLTNNFSDLAESAQDARLTYTTSATWPYYHFNVSAEAIGEIIEYNYSLKLLEAQLAKLDNAPIELSVKADYPKIYKKDCLNIEAKIKRLLSLAPLTLALNSDKWFVNKARLADWLELQINKTATTTDKIMIGLNQKKVIAYLEEIIAPDINEEPIDAKFEIKDGRVVEFQASRDGLELNTRASYEQLVSALVIDKNSRGELITRELKSKLRTDEINDLGIKEIIGRGESNFAGSPPNRRHNISVGASTLNGLIIKPDEEFSLNNALGEIEAHTGYLPELVIKDNKTIPEYGGGLCQIGTTMFRVALGTGLPITMRRNHSYRVSYYEPAGTDATIYSPWPDLKFINDTGNNILVQSRIEGDNLYFDMWGTSDGRIASRTHPIIYNIARPGPTKLIETLDLPAGEKKCTEHAHNGADAYFDYTVVYSKKNPPADIKEQKEITDEDLIKKVRFKSHYVPWREVCLVGVESLSTSTEKITK